MAKAASRKHQPHQTKNPRWHCGWLAPALSRNGEAGIRGGAPGDLYVVIHVKEHPIFQRDEDNLYCEVPIPFSTAALGGEIPVPTLDGKRV